MSEIVINKYSFVRLNDDGTITSKGTILNRNGFPSWSKKLYSATAKLMLEDQPNHIIVNYFINEVIKLFNNEVPIEDLTYSAKIKSNYKCPTFYMKMFTESMKNNNIHYQEGQIVKFVVCNKEKKLLGSKMVAIERFDPRRHQIDYSYYLGSITSNMDKLFSAFFTEARIEGFNFTYKNKHGEILNVTQLTNMTTQMINEGIDLTKLLVDLNNYLKF